MMKKVITMGSGAKRAGRLLVFIAAFFMFACMGAPAAVFATGGSTGTTSVTVPIDVPVSKAVAGAEVEITYTSGLAYDGFSPSASVKNARQVDTVRNGRLYLSVYTTSNSLSGNGTLLSLGNLDLHYTNTSDEVLTIKSVKLISYDEKGELTSEVHALNLGFTITPTGAGGGNDGGNTGGGDGGNTGGETPGIGNPGTGNPGGNNNGGGSNTGGTTAGTTGNAVVQPFATSAVSEETDLLVTTDPEPAIVNETSSNSAIPGSIAPVQRPSKGVDISDEAEPLSIGPGGAGWAWGDTLILVLAGIFAGWFFFVNARQKGFLKGRSLKNEEN